MSLDEHRAADAWRAIRVAGRPLVPPSIDTPRDVIRQAHMRLRELRLEARSRSQIDREGVQC